MVVNDAVFKRIESEIMSYHETLQEMEDLLIRPELFGGSTLYLIKRMSFLEEITDLIKKAYEYGKTEHKKIMDLYYWGSCNNWNELAEKFQTSKNVVLNYRNEIIFSIAYKLGWM